MEHGYATRTWYHFTALHLTPWPLVNMPGSITPVERCSRFGHRARPSVTAFITLLVTALVWYTDGHGTGLVHCWSWHWFGSLLVTARVWFTAGHGTDLVHCWSRHWFGTLLIKALVWYTAGHALVWYTAGHGTGLVHC